MTGRIRARRRAPCSAHFAVFAIALAGPLHAQAGVRIDANLNSTRIAAGESVVLRVNIETRGESGDLVELPDMPPGLQITGTQDFSQLQVSVPGGRTRLIQKDIIIRAHAPGQYTIPAVAVRVGGGTYRTRPLALTVDARRSGPSRTSGPPAPDEILLRAWIEPDTVYVGQQVLLHAETLFPRDLRQRQSRPASYEAPTPANFWIQDLPDAVVTGMRSIDGAVYETQTFRRAYFPLSPGRFTMPPARLVYEIRRGFLYTPESRELVSDSLRVHVLPIPEADAPSSYAGAVGAYTIVAKLAPEVVSAGDAVTLTVELTGSGNIKALPPPRLPELEGIEVYPPTEDARLDIQDDRIGGVKRFTWVLIPEQAHRIELPPIRYGYFDPEKRAFGEAVSAPLALRVTPARRIAGGTSADTALRPLAAKPARAPSSWMRSPVFAALQVVPFIALVGAVLLNRKGAVVRGRRARRQLRLQREQTFAGLARAASSAEPDRVFYGDFSAAVRAALADLLDQHHLRTAPPESLLGALRQHGASAELCESLRATFARIDRARFAPVPATAQERTVMVRDAKKLIDDVDRNLANRTTKRAGGAVMLVLLTVPAAAHAQAGADPTSTFGAGLVAYQQERYDEAVLSFSDYVRARPEDASGWYNLGNAYVRAQSQGHAVWAWMRALQLRPRHAAARHNLSATGASSALDSIPPPYTLSADEAVFIITALWWIGGLLVAGLLAARRRGVAPVAATTIALGLLTVLLALPALRHRPTAVALDPEAALLSAPTLRSEQLGVLGDGAAVTIVERRGEFWRVRIVDGREGWVEAAMFAEV